MNSPPTRVFVGGLADTITENELVSRFSSFGRIKNVEIIKSKFTGVALQLRLDSSRGFGYLDLDFSDGLSTYNGTLWNGKRLIVEAARSPRTPNALSSNDSKDPPPNVKRSTLKKNQYVFHSPLMASHPLVTDKNVSVYKHWKHGRYGRAVRSMRLKHPNGLIRVIDPLVHKNALEKLFGTQKPKPYHLLSWTIEDSTLPSATATTKTECLSSVNEKTDILDDSKHMPIDHSRGLFSSKLNETESEGNPKEESVADVDVSGDLRSLFDPLVAKNSENLFSITKAIHSFTKEVEEDATPQAHELRDLKSVLEAWVRSMPYQPKFVFSPLKNQLDSNYKMYFVKADEDPIDDKDQKSQRETLLQDLREIKISWNRPKKNKKLKL